MDFVGIGGLGEIIECTSFNRGHGACDIAVARQNDAARIGAAALQLADDFEAVAILQAHVDHGEGGWGGGNGAEPLADAFRRLHFVTTRLHGASKAGQEDFIVIYKKQATIGAFSKSELHH